ncbi:MAG TPA: CAP domain-containing protein [Phycisphaerae bacterium]|nr:CAP domain-containing protein [Phycisphaerae bacterium]HOJ74172.1 CAP domain-containing protein [Phycisphaerae bacterium]HOM51250.1 CAP domain-containing protein [Phycisphaerae bacterium]HOQ87164.1 CAP domain-containing protein [Phycisphaerae bacterium]HPP26785.1 CAP domain-containing protein [Phycisphaerae bacterium]
MSRRRPRYLESLLAIALLCLSGIGCVDPGTLPDPSPAGGDPADVPGGPPSNPSNSGTPGLGTANPDTWDACVQVGQPASPTHREMFNALNQYRASQGLAQLSYSKVLEKAADAHARDMYRRDFFDHVNPDGDGPADRAIDAGFCRIRMVGENIAWNQRNVHEVQVAWQNSPGHNANMVNPDFKYVGMGYYFSANGPYYVQLFGTVWPD